MITKDDLKRALDIVKERSEKYNRNKNLNKK